MEVVRGLDSLGPIAGPSAVTIGFFDGVHLGHRAVIARMLEVSSSEGVASVAVTFANHPREILEPGREPRLLSTLERRTQLIADLGVGVLVVLPFDEELASWSPEAFARRVLRDGLGARRVVVGANFTFGHRASGTVETLQDLGGQLGFDVEGVALVYLDGRPVSSSSIRVAVAAGDTAWPARALGRAFAVEGLVVRGAGRGAGLGYPTANLRVHPRLLLPGSGIYAGRAVLDGTPYVAAISVGTNPTFGSEPLHIEAFLLDFEDGLRGRELSVEFWERLRDEERFESPEELTRQMAEDVRRTREIVAAR